MSKSNHITLIGTVGRVRTHEAVDGKKFLTLSLAVNEGYRKADGTYGRRQTQWHQLPPDRNKNRAVN